MQVSAIPTGPAYYQPITPVPAVAAVKAPPTDGAEAGRKLRAATPPGVGNLLDIEA